MRTVWPWGDPNMGKTCFLRRFGIVYPCAEYKKTRGNFDVKYKHAKVAPAFILIEEGALKRFFHTVDCYDDAKVFFEAGGLVVETKMKNPTPRW